MCESGRFDLQMVSAGPHSPVQLLLLPEPLPGSERRFAEGANYNCNRSRARTHDFGVDGDDPVLA